jgi:hypothetical protein
MSREHIGYRCNGCEERFLHHEYDDDAGALHAARKHVEGAHNTMSPIESVYDPPLLSRRSD